MKKVVASLVLASLVSSSVSAVDVMRTVRSTSANTVEFLKANPKTVGLSAAGMLVVGSALMAYKYNGRARAMYKALNPINMYNCASSRLFKTKKTQTTVK